MPDHRILGLNVRSDIELPAPKAASLDKFDAVVRVSVANPTEDVRQPAWRREADGTFCFGIGRRRFQVSQNGDVHASHPSDEGPEHLVATLIGPALSLTAALKGRLPLHAAAFVVDESAWVMLAGRGTGKSTLAAALALAGIPTLGDDVCALDEQNLVHPGSYLIKLWPDSAEMLGLHSLTALYEGTAKLGFCPETWRAGPFPLGGLLFLDLAEDQEPSIQPITDAQAVQRLMTHCRGQSQLRGPEALASDLAWTARLASQVPARRVMLPRGPGSLARSVELVMQASGAATPGPTA